MDDRRLLCSLRDGFAVSINLPVDFNKKDADRLIRFIELEAEICGGVRRRKRGPNKTHSVIEEIQNKHKNTDKN